MKPIILPRQYVMLVIVFIVGSVLLLSFMDNMLMQDAWSAIPGGLLISLPFILCYAYLCKRFPGKNILEINDIVFGVVIGRFLSLFYVVFFFALLSFNLRDMADFYTGLVLTDTPLSFFLVVTALVSSYAVGKGIVPLARLCVFILGYTLITIAFTSLLLTTRMDLNNFLPAFETPLPVLLRGYHIIAALPLCEVFVFMMVMPGVDRPEKLTRMTLSGVGVAALLLLIISLRNTAVLGMSSSIQVGNSYQAVRMISIGDLFTRIELFLAISITSCLFVKIATCHFALVKGVTHVLGLRTGKPLIVPLGLLCVVLGYICYDSTIAHATLTSKYNMFYPLMPEFILPPVTVLVAALRHRSGVQKAAA